MNEFHILNLGAGVQSTMLYLLACEKHPLMEKIDCAIFADVGDEPRAVYAHLKWLQSLGGPEILVRSKGCLGDDLMIGGSKRARGNIRYCAIPAFTANGGMGVRQCTMDYKIEVINKTIRREIVGLKPRQRIPKDVHVHQYLGLSFDEARRVLRVWNRFQDIPWATAHFPLFETNTTRSGALQWLKNRVPHPVPRSACVYCPFHSQAEWRSVKDDPVDWDRACTVDDWLRGEIYTANSKAEHLQFVHRSLVPLREADLSSPNVTGEFGFVAECEGMCGI